MAFLINFFYRIRWAIIIALLIVAHFALGWSLKLVLIPLIMWIVHALIVTLIVRIGNYGSNVPQSETPNINPYSLKNENVLPNKNV